MKSYRIVLAVLALSLACFGQASDITGSAPLTSTCSNANTTCDTAGVTNFNVGSSFNVQGPQTIEVSTQSYGLAQVSASGTYSGSTLNFEFSDDGGTTWYINTCTRTDTNLQETSEAVSANAYRAWDCAVGAATKFRVRQSAIGSGGPIVKVTLTAGLLEPAPTVQLSSAGSNGANPCANPHANLAFFSTSATTNAATQMIALVAGQKVYVCSLSVIAGGVASSTFSLVYGTGSNCATGQTNLLPAFSIATANQLFAFSYSFGLTPAGQALCYLMPAGTSPTATVALTYVQQ